MIINNAKKWCQFPIWVISICLALEFIFLTVLLHLTGMNFYSENPYKFYYLAGIFAAYFFGFWPALVFIILGTGYANYWFVPPFGEFIFNYHDLQVWILNFLLGIACIGLIEYLQRERYKTKLLLLVAESRYLILLHRDNDLMNALKKDK
ncbi:DUF4118 domain-containing protein [Polynucleobacter sp. AP-Latsch-80-C2]|jgi:K+-sensing histidine kinase KdpD|uniref:DUF4118 domain-containing protein n=1 Tax=Polynucleobacter sp. AP-Latsch-80-C2 TaxID=2576931 RepID=UPI001C0AFC8A|nr:DUF4118 domain-containing protein [Polynucleobacter sp. AP-Latsch-80-C2]MBU3624123.1 DUF4118 domain-containing protein [Polynucleobacter sp. AP-Latsch-80-C2]